MGQIKDLVGAEGAEAIQTMVQNASKPGSGILASIIGFAVLIFGASTVAAELKASLDQVWNKKPAENAGIKELVTQRSYALVVVLGCGFLLLVSLAVSSALAAAGSFVGNMLPVPEFVLHILNLAVGIAVITGVFAVMFKYLPDANIQWRDVLLGALFTSVLFSIGKLLIGLYLGKASFGSTYGAAGSLVIVLVWVYYSSQILFFGAEFTQVYAQSHGSDPLQRRRKHPRKEDVTKGAAELGQMAGHGNGGLQSSADEKTAACSGASLDPHWRLRRLFAASVGDSGTSARFTRNYR